MSRFAFKMKLKKGHGEEYKKRHDKIWPEIVQLLKEAGVSDYSIFFDEESDSLFAYQMQQNGSSQDLGSYDIVKKWWIYMADIMETNPDNSPVIVPLNEVFHLE